MNKVAQLIQKREDDQESTYCCIFWPSESLFCQEALQRLGVYGNLIIKEFQFDLIPLDKDILSFEMEMSFRDLYRDGDLSCYTYVAETLMKFEMLYGPFRHIFGKGSGAKVRDFKPIEKNPHYIDNIGYIAK